MIALGYFNFRWLLIAVLVSYVSWMLSLTSTSVQRFFLYAHHFNTRYFYDVNEPHQFGFDDHQVTPFYLNYTEGISLFAWHILPILTFVQHRPILIRNENLIDTRADFKLSESYRILQQDPQSRVIISFHGNAGNIGESFRPNLYRLVSSTSPHVHVIAIDYRGFGISTGSPSESGLIADGIAITKYVIEQLNIPPHRIILMGQSLGTAVTSAVALHFENPNAPELIVDDLHKGFVTDHLCESERSIETDRNETRERFAGVFLIAPFSNMSTLVSTYRIGGVIPLLSPFKSFSSVTKMLSWFITDKWDSATRLEKLMKTDEQVSSDSQAEVSPGIGLHPHKEKGTLDLRILHAMDDGIIPYRHSVEIYNRVARDKKGSNCPNEPKRLMWESTHGGDHKRLQVDIIRYGGHNYITCTTQVQIAILEMFGLPTNEK